MLVGIDGKAVVMLTRRQDGGSQESINVGGQETGQRQ